MKKFLEHLKEESLPGVWSKGVQASRVLNSIEKTSPEGSSDELRFKITTPERMLAFEVTLWPAELDAHCNCGSKVEPCHHIVAVALAHESGTVKSKSDSAETPSLRLEYSWVYQAEESGKPARIRLKRALMRGAEEIPIPASLVAWVGGVRSGRIDGPLPSISPVDLKIDGIYSSDNPEWREVLQAISDLPPLSVSGHPGSTTLRVQRHPEQRKPRVRSLNADEWAIEFEPDPDLELLQGGLWIKNGVLGHGHIELSRYPSRVHRRELEGTFFSKFPELKGLFPEVSEFEPELTLTLHPMPGDFFSVTVRIDYKADPGTIVIRDPKKEAELSRMARERYQLIPDQPKTLSASELLKQQASGTFARFPEVESVLGSYLRREFDLDSGDSIGHQETLFKLLQLREKTPANAKKIHAMIRSLGQKDAQGSASLSFPESLREKLRPYQVSGVNWLLDRANTLGGAILADDMGLGKTLQTLAVLKTPSLVVVPVSLLQNWKSEAQRFRPELRVSIYHGPGRKWPTDADVVLTSYSLLGSEAARFSEKQWKVAVLDEAHIIRNPETRAALASATLNADFRLALTGTPIQNRMRDLWSLFQFVAPGLFEEEESLDLKTSAPFFLRRTKAQVLHELPPKTQLVHPVPFSESERGRYRAVFDAAKQEILGRLGPSDAPLSPLTLFEVLLRARQACNHESLFLPNANRSGSDNEQEKPSSSKLDAILELSNGLLEAGHSVLVYSQWTGFLDLMEMRMRAESLPYRRLDGSTKDRGEVTRAFQESDKPSVFLLSLHAGGVGLNLTRASHVIFCEPWWNPFVELQAEDRAYRMGQEKPVTIHRFQMEDSIEVRIGELQQAKLALGEGALTPSDLQSLLLETS